MNNAYQNMFYMYNPMMMMPPNMETKGQPVYYYPVMFDPTKYPKDMNGQNNMIYFQPMMPMYPTNFYDQGYMKNQNTKK